MWALQEAGVTSLMTVAQGRVDVGVGWSAFEHLASGRVQIIELNGPEAIERETTISLCKNSANGAAAERFLQFIAEGGADEFLARYGWLLPEARRKIVREAKAT